MGARRRQPAGRHVHSMGTVARLRSSRRPRASGLRLFTSRCEWSDHGQRARCAPPRRVRAARPAPLGGGAPEPEAARGVRMSARGLAPVHMSAVTWLRRPYVCTWPRARAHVCGHSSGVGLGLRPSPPRARGEACPPWRRGARARGCPRRPHVCTWARTRAHVCGHLAEASVCLHVATSPCTCLRSLKRRRAGAASHRAHSPWEAHGILEWPWLVSLFRAL